MACKTSYELHHNFPKLADEAGFAFNAHRPKIRIDWNRIKLLDVESLIRDRKFVLLEQHLNDVLDCVLESEFDVRILDEGVVKMFRLAQLTVEYQQFCRHYLDRSIFVLRDELTAVMQELESSRRTIREREEEMRKMKRKTKHTYRTPMYGNDNIANMIIKTLSNRGELFLPPRAGEDRGPQYNKCAHCDKIFLNQLYLKSHLQRRHAEFLEAPEKDTPETTPHAEEKIETKLNSEIEQLKQKLNEVEAKLLYASTRASAQAPPAPPAPPAPALEREAPIPSATVEHCETKDAEVTANNDSYVLEKIETWKQEEGKKYFDEINRLRTQMMESINAIKDKETVVPNHQQNVAEHLNKTIIEQGEEIMKLKEELSRSDTKAVIEEANRKNIEAQILLWTKKVEEQSAQYQRLVENLNGYAKEAQEARALGEAESRRAASLQAQLEARADHGDNARNNTAHEHEDEAVTITTRKQHNPSANSSYKTKSAINRSSLEELHRKAQELLNFKSSSSSDASRSSDDDIEVHNSPKPKRYKKTNKKNLTNKQSSKKPVEHVGVHNKKSNGKTISKKKPKENANIVKTKALTSPNHQEETEMIPQISPQKVVRAKLMEEVNSRLIAAGVDPLKNGLSKSIYNKQNHLLQKNQRLKMKKNGKYEKVRNKILVYLDSKARKETQVLDKSTNLNTKSRSTKPFSLTSMLSNVKHKALSFVKADVNSQQSTPVDNPISSKRSSADSGTQNSESASPEKLKPNIPDLFKISHRSRNLHNGRKSTKIAKKTTKAPIEDSNDETATESEHDYDDFHKDTKKTIENLIKSPIRRPATVSGNYDEPKKTVMTENIITRTQSANNVLQLSPKQDTRDSDSGALGSGLRQVTSEEIIPVGPKGVLKNAPSTSSLNKKKVLFDLDAIQMKSVSASPSQSTEKSDSNEKFELGLVNLEDEEWDISSIDNDPIKSHEHPSRISVASRASPKIAELKESIESQLARRNTTPSTLVVGGVDVLRGSGGGGGGGGALARAPSGSNTSLGSSLLDDTDDAAPAPRAPNLSSIKSKKIVDNKVDDSDLDLSEFSIDGVINKKRDSF